jgi:hypothetical protein
MLKNNQRLFEYKSVEEQISRQFYKYDSYYDCKFQIIVDYLIILKKVNSKKHKRNRSI